MPRYAGWKGKVNRFAALGTTVLGDDLYCHEPFCRALLDKPDSHKTLYEWVDDLDRNGVVKTAVHKRWTGKRHEIDTYRYVTAILIMTNSYWRESLMVVKAVSSI